MFVLFVPRIYFSQKEVWNRKSISDINWEEQSSWGYDKICIELYILQPSAKLYIFYEASYLGIKTSIL